MQTNRAFSQLWKEHIDVHNARSKTSNIPFEEWIQVTRDKVFRILSSKMPSWVIPAELVVPVDFPWSAKEVQEKFPEWTEWMYHVWKKKKQEEEETHSLVKKVRIKSVWEKYTILVTSTWKKWHGIRIRTTEVPQRLTPIPENVVFPDFSKKDEKTFEGKKPFHKEKEQGDASLLSWLTPEWIQNVFSPYRTIWDQEHKLFMQKPLHFLSLIDESLEKVSRKTIRDASSFPILPKKMKMCLDAIFSVSDEKVQGYMIEYFVMHYHAFLKQRKKYILACLVEWPSIYNISWKELYYIITSYEYLSSKGIQRLTEKITLDIKNFLDYAKRRKTDYKTNILYQYLELYLQKPSLSKSDMMHIYEIATKLAS